MQIHNELEYHYTSSGKPVFNYIPMDSPYVRVKYMSSPYAW